MTNQELTGLPLEDALALLKARGITPEVVTAMPLGRTVDPDNRTARVVRLRGNQLMVSLFKDAAPEDES